MLCHMFEFKQKESNRRIPAHIFTQQFIQGAAAYMNTELHLFSWKNDESQIMFTNLHLQWQKKQLHLKADVTN